MNKRQEKSTFLVSNTTERKSLCFLLRACLRKEKPYIFCVGLMDVQKLQPYDLRHLRSLCVLVGFFFLLLEFCEIAGVWGFSNMIWTKQNVSTPSQQTCMKMNVNMTSTIHILHQAICAQKQHRQISINGTHIDTNEIGCCLFLSFN